MTNSWQKMRSLWKISEIEQKEMKQARETIESYAKATIIRQAKTESDKRERRGYKKENYLKWKKN